MLGKDWQPLKEAVTMRNKIVHGEAVYSRDDCNDSCGDVLKALGLMHDAIVDSYFEDTWKKQTLRATPKVKWLYN